MAFGDITHCYKIIVLLFSTDVLNTKYYTFSYSSIHLFESSLSGWCSKVSYYYPYLLLSTKTCFRSARQTSKEIQHLVRGLSHDRNCHYGKQAVQGRAAVEVRWCLLLCYSCNRSHWYVQLSLTQLTTKFK